MKEEKLTEYYDALNRIETGKTIVVSPKEKITLKSVALEAGKSAGVIKKSRPLYAQLIIDIKKSADEMGSRRSKEEIAIGKAKKDVEKYRALYEESLSREIVLMSKLMRK